MIASLSQPVWRLGRGLKLGAALLCLTLPIEGQATTLTAGVGEELRVLRTDIQAAQPSLQLAQAGDYQGDRIAAFETVIRDLTGRVEGMEYRLRQLEERLNRLEQATEAPAAQPTERPSAYYEPPGEPPSAQGGPRVLGTPTDSFANEAPVGAADGGERGSPAQDTRPEASTGPQAADGAQAALPSAALPDGDAASQYDYAFGLLRQARWDDAEAALEAFLAQHPEDRLAGNAKYWLGETHYVRGDYVSAARVFAEGFQTYPDSSKAPDNLLKLGMSLGMLDRRDDACGTLAELERRYSDAPAQILQRSRTERERLGC